MSGNILDPAALISLLPTLLPESSKTLSNPQDGIAALLHSALSALAFRLTAVANSSSLSSNSLPIGWNLNGPSHYELKYRHDQSSLEFVFKISRLGGRTVINAIAIESDKLASLDISTNDFVSPSFYPYDLNSPEGIPLIHGFISSNRVTDLMNQFKLMIVQKLIPGLRKDGYTEETEQSSASSHSAPSARVPPRSPYSGTDNNHFRPPPLFPENPLEIGRRDLDPFASIGNPFSPPSLFPPGNGGDGMFVGPNHPIFGGTRGPGMPSRGPWGGDGYLPPMGAPPGARFDPVGPSFIPNRPDRGSLGPGTRIPPQGGINRDPDNDEFMPPGADSMYM